MPYAKKSFKRKYSKSKFGGKHRKTAYKRKSYTKRSSTSNYRKNAGISKYIKSYAETKKQINQAIVKNLAPDVTVLGSNVWQLKFDFANGITGGLFGTALNNTTLTQGSSAAQREGKYVFWKSIQGNIRIKMQNQETIDVETRGPVRFKVIFFRNKRKFTAPGVTSDPTKLLFLLPNGDPVGPESLDGTGDQHMTELNFFTAPFNYRHFDILKTHQFTLQAGIDIQRAASSMAAIGNLPSHKIIKFNVPINQKTRYDTNNFPTDRDLHTRMYVLSMPTGGGDQAEANNWNMDMDSVGLFTDL